MGRGNDDDEDVGEGVITRSGVSALGAFRKIFNWIGSSPLSTAGGRGPHNAML